MKVGAAYAEEIAEFLGAAAVYRVVVYRVPYIFELRVVRNSFTRRDFRGIALGDTIERVMGQRYHIRARCATTTDQQKSMAESLIKKAIDSNIETAVDDKNK